MKSALKSKWVAALRSGKYKQTKQTLKREEADGSASFCCLGVLCEISPAVRERVTSSEILGASALAYAGFSSDQEDILMELNDGGSLRKRRTFRGIATWIEKNL
jgi:hypothetical protein